MLRTARNTNFTATPIQSLVLAAVDKNLDWVHVETLLEQLEKAGSLDASAVWDDRGNGLLGALLAMYRTQSEKTPPQSVLSQCLRLDPSALTRQNLAGDTALDLFLDHYAQRESAAARQLPWIIEHADKEALLRWTPMDNHTMRHRFVSPGVGLLHILFHVEHYAYSASDNTQLDLVLGLGISPNQRDAKNIMEASGISSAAQWEVFLQSGGDPRLTFPDDHHHHHETPAPKTTLWEYLVNYRSGELVEVVRQWASANAGDDIASKDIADYWAKLARSADRSVSPTDISAQLRLHPDWLTLRDEQGRTPAMYGIRMHASAWRTLEQKRMAPMLQERDTQGRNLWHYALSRGSHVGSDTVRFLKNAGVSADPSPVTGRGLIASLYLDNDLKEGFRPTEILSRANEVTKTLIKHTTASQWWTMPQADVAPVVAALVEHGFQDKRYHPFDEINELLKAHAKDISDPHLLGLAVLFNLGGYQPDRELLRDCFARGAIFDLNEEKMAALRKMAEYDLYEEAMSLLEHNKLSSSTPSSPSRKVGPRL
jgi:hypothetical protein